jgi:hypothetical protein
VVGSAWEDYILNVYIQRRIDEDWQVWTGDKPDAEDSESEGVVVFHPGDKDGYYLDAYSYGKMLSERLGVELIEVPQPR